MLKTGEGTAGIGSGLEMTSSFTLTASDVEGPAVEGPDALSCSLRSLARSSSVMESLLALLVLLTVASSSSSLTEGLRRNRRCLSSLLRTQPGFMPTSRQRSYRHF